MNNTKVTIKYANGDTREFVASDELDKLIVSGEMFSFTTIHPDQDDTISKMYAGNPMAALGNMIVMRHNAKNLDSDEEQDKDIIIDVLNACIKLLSDEITSHDSGLVPVRLVEVTDPSERRFTSDMEQCPVTESLCGHYSCQLDSNGEVAIEHCSHPENSKDEEGNCTSLLCPLCTEGGG